MGDTKKIGVYMDSEIWDEMKKFTFGKHGTTRKLSSEVVKILRGSLPSLILKEGMKKLGIEMKRMSEKEIVEGRPAVQGDSADIIKEMRARA